MVLYLEISNPSFGEEGVFRSITFYNESGKIGSDPSGYWNIQDIAGGVPSHCADIIFDGVVFLLRAVAPIVYVNGSRKPLGVGKCIILSDQDELSVGQLRIHTKIGTRAYVENRPLPLETLLAESSDALTSLLVDDSSSGDQTLENDPGSTDPLTLLEEDKVLRSTLDPMLNFNQHDKDTDSDDIVKLIGSNRSNSTMLTMPLGSGQLDPFSAPVIRSDRYGFEKLAEWSLRDGPSACLSPDTIEAEVAKNCARGTDEFIKQCWLRFSERFYAELEDLN